MSEINLTNQQVIDIAEELQRVSTEGLLELASGLGKEIRQIDIARSNAREKGEELPVTLEERKLQMTVLMANDFYLARQSEAVGVPVDVKVKDYFAREKSGGPAPIAA